MLKDKAWEGKFKIICEFEMIVYEAMVFSRPFACGSIFPRHHSIYWTTSFAKDPKTLTASRLTFLWLFNLLYCSVFCLLYSSQKLALARNVIVGSSFLPWKIVLMCWSFLRLCWYTPIRYALLFFHFLPRPSLATSRVQILWSLHTPFTHIRQWPAVLQQ